MPIFEFLCECNTVYEKLTSYDEAGVYPGIVCPECGSEKKEKLISACSFQFGNPVGTDRWQDHDYRYKYNIPNVKRQREAAEKGATSKTGFTSRKPYNHINDLNKNNFGPVK